MGNTNTTGDTTELPVQFRETDENTFKGDYHRTFRIEDLSKSTPGEVREKLGRHHYNFSDHDLTNKRRAELAVFTSEHPEVVRDWLLDSRMKTGGVLDRVHYWLSAIEPLDISSFPKSLTGAVHLFLGATEEDSRERSNRFRLTDIKKWLESHCPYAIGSEEHQFFTLVYRSDFGDSAIATKLTRDVENVIEDQPDLIISDLPWLTAMREPDMTDVLVRAGIEHAEVVDALRRQAVEIPLLSERSLGLALKAEQAEAESIYLWNTDKKYFKRPTPLNSPSSTWLNDPSLEHSLKATISNATDSFRNEPGEAEEILTGSLLTALRLKMEGLNKIPSSGRQHRLAVEYLPPRKLDEKKNGADVIILVNIDGRKLVLRKAHFAQVKGIVKDKDKPTERTAHAKWTIDFKQLKDLLSSDETATYWLLGPNPDREVLVVPASFLRAMMEGKLAETMRSGQEPTGSMTVHYSEIRSTAIPLEQLLVDLVIGVWLGTTKQDSLKYADGSVFHRKPAYLLTINITSVSE